MPPDAVTVIPFAGSTPAAPLAGAIVTTGSGFGFARADPPPAGFADRDAPCAAGFTVVPPAVHAVAASASPAMAANTDTARMPLMTGPFPPTDVSNADIL